MIATGKTPLSHASLLILIWLGAAGIVLTAQEQSERITSIAKWTSQANAGDANAAYELGLNYHLGLLVPKDPVEAARWLQQAAKSGNAPAQSLLGRMFAHGDGVLPDQPKAIKWLSMAAVQNDATAQYELGIAYEHGRGVPKDLGQP